MRNACSTRAGRTGDQRGAPEVDGLDDRQNYFRPSHSFAADSTGAN